MPLILPSNSISAGGYEVDNSLRFDDGSSDYLNRTQSAGNRKTFTISAWVKRSALSTDSTILNSNTTGTTHDSLAFSSSDTLSFFSYSGSFQCYLVTNRVFRDTSAWYHLVIKVDTTQATASDRVKIYVNGVQETSFSTETYPSLNYDFILFNNSARIEIGARKTSGDVVEKYFDGYMAEACFIDGQALDPTSFGEFDADTGIWKPIDVSGLTFGTNGFYLDFENSGSLGADVSGNGNNFTVNNLTSIDQTTDTPTNNYATLNPLWRSRWQNTQTFSNGNNSVATSGTSEGIALSSLGVTQGKWYFEVKYTDATRGAVGVAEDRISSFTNAFYDNSPSYGTIVAVNGQLNANNVWYASYTGSTYSTNDIVMIALDMDNHLLWFGKNGTWSNSATQTEIENGTATNDVTTLIGTQAIINSGEPIFPLWIDASGSSSGSASFNFGSPPYTISTGNSDANGYGNFEYSVPSGYYALNTKNLAEYG